ncbi:unnamed protein product [Sphagnum jensenii]|uniref:Protein kinase domain-containing protein n=1 Tax=Sphagnum jensenii TaxID=128206 RepID=A0ABP1B313_9BRYO
MDQREAQDIAPPFSLLESVDIMLQVAKAMRFLHSKGVAHRDLKCQNILWKHGQFDQLVVKLGDFGDAESNVKNSTTNQQQTWMVGTTGWRAPELSGEHMLTDKRYPLMADVFSFGMTFLEILTGETPFVGNCSENDIEGCQVICNPTEDHGKDPMVNLNPNEDIVQNQAESSLHRVNYTPMKLMSRIVR